MDEFIAGITQPFCHSEGPFLARGICWRLSRKKKADSSGQERALGMTGRHEVLGLEYMHEDQER